MRFFIGGPRLFGVRTGLLLSPKDLGFGAERTTQNAPEGTIDGGFVYVIRGDHNLTKIGFSTNPTARLATLRTASPFPIDFAYVCAVEGDAAGAMSIEAAAHAMLTRQRVNGEWFDVPPEMAVAAISAASQTVGRKIVQIDKDKVDLVLHVAAQPAPAPRSFGRKLLKYAAIGFAIWVAIDVVILMFSPHYFDK